MKKKLIALLAAVMVLGSTTTALAAPSVTADDVEAGTVAQLEAAMTDATTDLEGATLSIDPVTDETVLTELKETVAELLQTSEADDKAKILAMADISIDKVIPEGGIKITLSVDGVFSTDSASTIKAYHFNGTKWEELKVNEVSGGKVVVTVTSLSPVAIVKVIPTAGKFGVEFTVLPMLAAAGLIGTTVCGKKVKFNK